MALPLELDHFRPLEFDRGGRSWWHQVDPGVLLRLDVFRQLWGKRVDVSDAAGAVGRQLGPDVRSDHNVDLHGRVNAVDVMPWGMVTRADAERAVELARSIGFTAIGVYPHWRPSPGLHLGRRAGIIPGNPALWGAIRAVPGAPQTYVTIARAIEEMPRGHA